MREELNLKRDCRLGQNVVMGQNITLGKNVVLGHNCIIEDNVTIGDNTFIDSNTIVRRDVSIGANSFVESNCIIGEYWMDFCIDREYHKHSLKIGENALIRSGSIIYSGSEIGNGFTTGHQVTVREKSHIGDNVSVGTLSDLQGDCTIGNYVRLHSNVHVGQLSVIDDFVWIFPYVVLTNDPTPPSNVRKGVHIYPFSIIATGAIIMPGVEVKSDSLVAAGALVTKDVENYEVVGGNPGKVISDIRKIKDKVTGEPAYPWRYHYSNYMPWDKTDYDTWYRSLDINEKEYFHLE